LVRGAGLVPVMVVRFRNDSHQNEHQLDLGHENEDGHDHGLDYCG
jgi:hypothetical protein